MPPTATAGSNRELASAAPRSSGFATGKASTSSTSAPRRGLSGAPSGGTLCPALFLDVTPAMRAVVPARSAFPAAFASTSPGPDLLRIVSDPGLIMRVRPAMARRGTERPAYPARATPTRPAAACRGRATRIRHGPETNTVRLDLDVNRAPIPGRDVLAIRYPPNGGAQHGGPRCGRRRPDRFDIGSPRPRRRSAGGQRVLGLYGWTCSRAVHRTASRKGD